MPSAIEARRLLAALSTFLTTDGAELGLSIDDMLEGFEAHERSECELLQKFFPAGDNQAEGRLDAS